MDCADAKRKAEANEREEATAKNSLAVGGAETVDDIVRNVNSLRATVNHDIYLTYCGLIDRVEVAHKREIAAKDATFARLTEALRRIADADVECTKVGGCAHPILGCEKCEFEFRRVAKEALAAAATTEEYSDVAAAEGGAE